MTVRLTGYICPHCGFSIIELTPIPPVCPACTMYNWKIESMVEVDDASRLKYVTMVMYMAVTSKPIETYEWWPIAD